MPHIRAFIAVEIDQPSRQKISSLISGLKKSNADVKWITEDQMHLTLKFLGNIDEGKIHEISSALSSISHDFKPFEITLSDIGAFPNLDHPRVIWIEIEKGADLLKTLAGKIDSRLEKLGFQKETREFKAHLTLGRVRTSKNMPQLVKIINETQFAPETGVKINELILFQSTLTPKGTIYTKLWTT
ncbi:MAG: RNA 2',3'-cyclic phosphodiesterase [Candidatus Omnitrophota bacterium]|nr:RNA 2',3'-cyclic phosphodiesterase [Candidatus Omnitrophota bacterium]